MMMQPAYWDENAALKEKLKEMKNKMKESHKGFEERDRKRAETDSSFKEHYESENYQEMRKK